MTFKFHLDQIFHADCNFLLNMVFKEGLIDFVIFFNYPNYAKISASNIRLNALYQSYGSVKQNPPIKKRSFINDAHAVPSFLSLR